MSDKQHLVTPDLLREIYSDVAHFKCDFHDILRKYAPDVEKYKDMVLIVMAHYTVEHDMWWQAYEIMKKEIFDHVCQNCNRLVEVLHNVNVRIRDLVTKCEDDPYKIANYLKTTTVPCTHIMKNGYATSILKRADAPIYQHVRVNAVYPRTQSLNRSCDALEPYVRIVDSPPKENLSPRKVIKKEIRQKAVRTKW